MAKQPKKWIDAQGQEVPAKYVTAYDKERDAIARRIHARFVKCRDLLETCYCASMQDVEELERLAGREQKVLGGAKGNLQFQSFDGLIQVSRMARYEIRFDERLQAARDLIYAFMDEKANGIDEDIAVVIRQVFQPTSDGLLSQSRVLGLFAYNIKKPMWIQAMDLIRASIATKRGKTLIACADKSCQGGEFTPILLDLAKCAGLYDADSERVTPNV